MPSHTIIDMDTQQNKIDDTDTGASETPDTAGRSS